jgi:ATP-dependent exoDNAse (exonuclease V) alpha subunit
MIAVREAYEASGYTVIGAALSNQAARILQAEAGIESRSIAKTLWDLDPSHPRAPSDTPLALNARTVLILDEGGMVDTPAMARLVAEVERTGAKLVMVGDERQLQPIGPGGGFQAARGIARHVGADAELRETRRQRVGWQRQAAAALAQGEAWQALVLYHAEGRLVVDEGPALHARLVADWIRDRLAHPDQTQAILAATHGQGAALNRAAQAALRNAGLLGPQFADGLLTARQGRQSLYAGDEVAFRAKDRRIGVINGDRGRVVGLDTAGRIQVRIEDGRVVAFDPTAYRDWTLGYASTIHKSQGATVDRAYYAVSSYDKREMAYVAGSRHREDLRVYVDRALYDTARTQQAVQEDRLSLIDQVARRLERSNEKALAIVEAQRHRSPANRDR